MCSFNQRIFRHLKNAGKNAEWYSHFGRQFGSFYKTRQTLIYHLATVFFDIYPNELKPDVPTKIHTQMLIALFIIAKIEKQLRYPSTADSVNSLWFCHTMENYSAMRRSEPSSHEKTWRKLKCILLSVRSQAEKINCYMTLTI